MFPFLIILILSPVAQGRLTFLVKEGESECFYLDATSNEKYAVVVDILGGGALEIDLKVPNQ
jgi:hypothetical protein